jgi:hypothetical protein
MGHLRAPLAASTPRKDSAVQRLSNYKDCIIGTSVLPPEGKQFEASFFVGRRVTRRDDEIICTDRLVRTFAYGGDARAAAKVAAHAYIDNRDQLVR